MIKAETKGICVSVACKYLPLQSDSLHFSYVFAYTITIENKSEVKVQLLRRHWHIFDSNGEYREVEGEGVVGEQPIIEAGDSFIYSSGCNLLTEIGKMQGTYLMKNLLTDLEFKVNIPEFYLITTGKLN